MNEIEAMIQLIGSSAIQGDMYYGKAKDFEKIQKELNDDDEDIPKPNRILMGDQDQDDKL